MKRGSSTISYVVAKLIMLSQIPTTLPTRYSVSTAADEHSFVSVRWSLVRPALTIDNGFPFIFIAMAAALQRVNSNRSIAAMDRLSERIGPFYRESGDSSYAGGDTSMLGVMKRL